jgi:hypothetical protein
MFSWRRLSLVTSIVVLTGLLTPGLALAAKPTIERLEVSDTFEDEFLTEQCGVAVTTTFEGKLAARSFENRTKGVTEVFTINIGFTATSDHGEFRFRDVGADVTRVLPDGTLVVSISGQIPFTFTGIEREDGEGNVIFESGGDRGTKQLAAACAALTP